MLAHSPPLPLIINYVGLRQSDITTEDEEAILLALGHHDHVRRIRLWMPARTLQKLVTAIDDYSPILEYLDLQHREGPTPGLTPPATFQAPYLRFLIMDFAPLLLRSPWLITSAGGITTLYLLNIPSLALPPNDLIQQLSLMPHLKTLGFTFRSPVPNRDVRRLLQTPITTHATLPNLHSFMFNGVSAYLEALFPRMTAPLLENPHIGFFNQLTFSVPCLLQFMRATEIVGFSYATFRFYDAFVGVKVLHREAPRKHVFDMVVPCSHLDWQVSSIAQIVSSLDPVFSAVEHLQFSTRNIVNHRRCTMRLIAYSGANFSGRSTT
jgi:hypothetical protein